MNPLASSSRRLQSTQAGPSAPTSAPWMARLMQRQREFPRRLFCQELAVLLDAGIPLYEALQTLKEKEGDAAVASVLARLCVALSEGQTLAQAMRVQPEAFTTLLVASIEAAQRTGQLTQAR